MPPLLLLLVAMYLVATWTTPDAEFSFDVDAPCAGEPRPVDEETLVRTLARYGVDLERDDGCFGESGDPAAMFTNIPTAKWLTPEAEVIFASEGHVWCELHADDRFGDAVTRWRGDEGVVLRVLNVDCTIDESDPWQIERLDDAMEQLARAG